MFFTVANLPLGQFNTICRSRHGEKKYTKYTCNFDRTMVDTFDHEALLVWRLQGIEPRGLSLGIKAAIKFHGKTSSSSRCLCLRGRRMASHTRQSLAFNHILQAMNIPCRMLRDFRLMLLQLQPFFSARCWLQPRNFQLLNLGDRSHRTVWFYCRHVTSNDSPTVRFSDRGTIPKSKWISKWYNYIKRSLHLELRCVWRMSSCDLF